jgi:hypothetical protein
MRKYQQKQILELIATLYEATDEIKRQFTNGNNAIVINLLGDCQDVAVNIGEFIESLEGEDTRTVKLLTAYHESLYRIAMAIETANVSFVKKLKKELGMIESSIRSELKPNKIEVAFFPYKASMWDALESIWLAANEDPQCDAYVVPIPYFDRLADGGAGQMHYEGHQYPDYVPIVDWQTYNIEERRPDVSFIHNGYDGYNMVTSVHPNYYSKNLKNHTELLCYSPYFVASNVEDHSCTLSGVVHSDRVFVQSDKARDDYIRAIQAFEKEHNCAGRFGKVKEKIVASGSPKFDKVINSKPDDYTLPDEWKKLIVKSDGSRKKTVLYNTSIGPLLKGNKKYLEKLRSVFNAFRNRDDVVLWWRPHPLSEVTYGSMRPYLLEEYKQLIKEYRLEGYGIYDDTSDLHRALSLSSAFYGDGSSLMQLYQCMRKPVMVQYEDLSDLELLSIGSLCDTGEHLWFLTLRFNGLFRLNKKSWKAEYIGSFVRGNAFDWSVYHTIHQSGNKLYFSPHSAEAIAVYDLVESSFQYVELPLPQKDYSDQSKFAKIIEWEGSLYFIPLQFPGIVKLNVEDNSIELIDDWVKPIDKMIFDPSLGYFSNGVYDEARGLLVLSCFNSNAVMEIDLKNKTTILNAISSDKCGYSDILKIDETYWLLALHKSSLVSINILDNTMMEYEINLEGIPLDGYWLFQKIVHSNNFLYLVPANAQRLVKFNLTDHSFSYVDDFCPAEDAQKGYFYMSSSGTNKVYVTERQNKQFIEYDPIKGSLRQKSIIVTEGLWNFQNFLVKRQSGSFDNANSCAFWEHPYVATLENLLDMITQPVSEPWLDERLDKQIELHYSEISHPDGKAGLEIYEHCKKAVLK